MNSKSSEDLEINQGLYIRGFDFVPTVQWGCHFKDGSELQQCLHSLTWSFCGIARLEDGGLPLEFW